MASIVYGVRDIYAELTEYCDKKVAGVTRLVHKAKWKARAKRKREAQRIKESKWK